MPFSELFRRQAGLVIDMLPYVALEDCFALKGGTAINLFLRDMPRLSVDIDLTYLPIAPRDESLRAIDAAMKHIAHAVRATSPAEAVIEQTHEHEGAVTKLIARNENAQVKIEVTPVLRGCVHPPDTRVVAPSVEDAFGYAEIQVVSFADLYAGKIVAALDRQHPRDLFDVRDLLSHEGIDDSLRQAFLVYLLSHNRPIHEVIAPRPKDIAREFQRGFSGMTEHPIDPDDLLRAREEMIASVVGDMPEAHKRLLHSFVSGSPDWCLVGLDGVADLPAIRWRQRNLERVTGPRREELIEQLERVLWP